MKASFKLLAAVVTLSAVSLSVQADNDPALYRAMEKAQKTLIQAAQPVLRKYPGILVGIEAEREGSKFRPRLEYTYEIFQVVSGRARVVEVTTNAATGHILKTEYERAKDLPTLAQLKQMKRAEEILFTAEQSYGKYAVSVDLDKEGRGYNATYVYDVTIQHQYTAQEVVFDANSGTPIFAGGGTGGGGSTSCPSGTSWDWEDGECEGEYGDWEYEDGQWEYDDR